MHHIMITVHISQSDLKCLGLICKFLCNIFYHLFNSPCKAVSVAECDQRKWPTLPHKVAQQENQEPVKLILEGEHILLMKKETDESE